MDIPFTITKSEFQNIMLKFICRNYFTFGRLVIIYLLTVFSCMIFTTEKWIFYFLGPFSVLILYSLYTFTLKFIVPLLKFKKSIDPNKQYATITLSANKDNIVLATPNVEKIIWWRDVVSVKNFDNNLIICLLDNTTLIIPWQSFTEEKTCDECFQSIQNGILKSRGTLKAPLFLRPPYLLGVLCFVPVLGVYIGIVFILFGIFQYKNKYMVIIGCIGIAFTIILYSILFPEIWNKKDRDLQMIHLSKMELNLLIKDIEYFKLQTGKYPETLDQLRNSNLTIVIFDPLQPVKGSNSEFNYRLVGEKYQLFSSGVDNIPNNKDDIFPEIKDISKVGFIK